MFPIVVGISLAKSVGPFLRNHVLQAISIAEFIFINSAIIMILSFTYAYVHKQESLMNLLRLSQSQYCAILVISIVTIISGFAIVRLEENGILSSMFLLRTAGSICAVFVGIFMFEEQLTIYKILGIVLAVLSASLLIS
jgi:hypothetical protein